MLRKNAINSKIWSKFVNFKKIAKTNVEKFLEFLEFLLQENSLFFSLLTRNQKPRKMPCVVSI